MAQATVEASDTVICVAYQLPLHVERDESVAGGFKVTWNHDAVLNRQALNLPTRVLWVGCIGIRVSGDEEEALGDMLLSTTASPSSSTSSSRLTSTTASAVATSAPSSTASSGSPTPTRSRRRSMRVPH